MIAELHHVGMHGSRLGSIDLPSSESNGPHSSPAGTQGLHAATATRAGNGRTSGSQYAQRVRGRTFTPLSGANGNQDAASLAQLARPRTRHGPDTGTSAGGRPVFPRPERVVRVGARLCGQKCPDLAGAGRTNEIDAPAFAAIRVRLFRTLVT